MKKLIIVLLLIVMVVQLLPVVAFAEEGGAELQYWVATYQELIDKYIMPYATAISASLAIVIAIWRNIKTLSRNYAIEREKDKLYNAENNEKIKAEYKEQLETLKKEREADKLLLKEQVGELKGNFNELKTSIFDIIGKMPIEDIQQKLAINTHDTSAGAVVNFQAKELLSKLIDIERIKNESSSHAQGTKETIKMMIGEAQKVMADNSLTPEYEKMVSNYGSHLDKQAQESFVNIMEQIQLATQKLVADKEVAKEVISESILD